MPLLWVSTVRTDMDRLGLESVFGVRDWRHYWVLGFTTQLQIATYGRLQSEISENLSYAVPGASGVKVKLKQVYRKTAGWVHICVCVRYFALWKMHRRQTRSPSTFK